jgi:hypothetical protein
MKPQQQHRADQLEELLSSHSDQNVSVQMRPGVSDGVDPEVSEMARLAQHLQASPPLMPDPVFIQRLERKVLAHSLRHAQTRRSSGLSLPAQDKPHWLANLVKGKVLVATVVGAVLLGGIGVVLAATPSAHDLEQNLPGIHATTFPTQKPGKTDTNHGIATANANKQGQTGDAHACAGLPEAQQLATKFSLSTDATGNALQVICALHNGSFQTTVNGKSLTTGHALGYGEIDLLLTYAQVLTSKDGAKLTENNVQKYVTTVLNTCGSTPIVPCIKSKMGESEHDNHDNHDNSEKPTSVPTSHANGKPTSVPTPHADGTPAGTSTP